MIPDRDIFADKHGKLTDDPECYAVQIAVKGCFLDDAVAKRFGVTDTLVSTAEPVAVRKVRTVIEKPEAKTPEPIAEPADEPEAEPEAEEPKSAATEPVAKKDTDKGAKKK